MPMPPRMLTFQGRTQSLNAWAKELGIPPNTLRSRLDRLGQTVEQALSAPSDGRFRPGQASHQADQPKPPPAYLRDRATGQAYSRWYDPITKERRRRTWGPWKDEASAKAYRRWAAEWMVVGGDPDTQAAVSVATLVIRYLEYAEQRYQKHGKATSEIHGVRASLAKLNDLYGDSPVEQFRPRCLQALQKQWVESGLALSTCNSYQHRVVRCFSWGVARDLVPAAIADALKHVETVKPGRTSARAKKPVQSAPDADLEKCLPFLHPSPERREVLIAMLRLQRLSGMRPGEVAEMTASDIDRSAEPWLYKPASGGKTYHLERDRKVYLGPKSRELLAPWLARSEPGKPLFRLPARGGRLVKIHAGYLRHRLALACRAAGVPVIRPHQVRHTYATALHELYEDDAAVAAAIGDTPEVARRVYVDSPADRVARRIAETVG